MPAASTGLLTEVHVLISLLGLFAGAVLVVDLLRGRIARTWATVFLWTTILTSVTGFLFRSASFGPPHVVGAISLVVLAIACVAYYRKQLHGAWRRSFVIAALFAFYLNAFVGVVQAFGKIPALNALAPTQEEPPFVIAQATVLVLFAALTVLAVRTRAMDASEAPPRSAASAQ